MTIDIEEQLAAGMRQEVAGVTLATDVLHAATRAHRRRTLLHRGAYAAGVVGLAGVLAVAVTTGGTGDTAPQAGPPAVAGEAPANVRLVAAVAASEKTSYRIRVTTEFAGEPGSRETAEGAFDPAARTGYLRTPIAGGPAYAEQRLIAGARFLGSTGSETWKQERGRYDRLDYAGAAPQGTVVGSADPEDLFAALRRADVAVSQTGPDTYHFESSESYDDRYASGTRRLVGTVTVREGRIATIAFESTNEGRMKPGVKQGVSFDSTWLVTVALSDYGTPVRVQRPATVVVVR
ncbi:hypothetical protein [Micromonospora costi]|uniref:Uncharacterized protein n=1 Tax=Micromonospora costi TaxID=1530042 RepID=A0A3B0AAC4_9ACTN|nr:hypothetical protein [Micromonospora costi]RKN57483.1 hypothetical protein D7193_02050 [Micromonospora costi]